MVGTVVGWFGTRVCVCAHIYDVEHVQHPTRQPAVQLGPIGFSVASLGQPRYVCSHYISSLGQNGK